MPSWLIFVSPHKHKHGSGNLRIKFEDITVMKIILNVIKF